MITTHTLDPNRIAVYDGDHYLGTVHQAVSGRWRWKPGGPTFDTKEEAITALTPGRLIAPSRSPWERTVDYLASLPEPRFQAVIREALEQRDGGSVMCIRQGSIKSEEVA